MTWSTQVVLEESYPCLMAWSSILSSYLNEIPAPYGIWFTVSMVN